MVEKYFSIFGGGKEINVRGGEDDDDEEHLSFVGGNGDSYEKKNQINEIKS